jgi:hypothetical protein
LTFSAGGDFNWKAKINSAGQGRYLGVEIAAGNRLAPALLRGGVELHAVRTLSG